MAVDKLVDSAWLENGLSDIADAIREKTGKSASMEFPIEFVSEIGNIGGGGGVTWTEFTATSTAGNIQAARDLLFPNYSEMESVVIAAILKNKSVANFPNNQLIALVQFKFPFDGAPKEIGNAARYRNGGYNGASIAGNYDGIIEVGDTFDLLEVTIRDN